MYTTEWTVRFGDIDQARTLYYPRLFDNVHRLFERMMDDLGHPLPEVIERHETAMPIVEVDASYHAPIRYGDRVTVDITPDPGDTSLRLEYVGTRGEDGTRLFDLTETRVTIDASDYDDFRPIPIPDPIRETLRDIAGAEG